MPGSLKNPLRTLHINTERTWRGGEQQTLYLAAGLARRGHIAHLAAQPGSLMALRGRAAGIETFEIKMRSEGDIIAMCKIARLMRKNSYDIVHSHTSHAHFLAWFAAKFGGKPARIVSRRVDFSIYKHALSFSRIKYMRGADHYITVSEAVRGVLVRDGVPADRISVAYSGIDAARFPKIRDNPLRREFALPPGSPVVGNIGHMVAHKGQIFLVEAAPLILQKFPDARFFIVGDGPLRTALADRARELALDGKIFFPGFRTDIAEFLNLFDVFVMPSRTEGLGTSVLDALACGAPVVASSAGGIPEMIEHGRTGRLVEPENPAALADGVINLLSDRTMARALADEGRKMVSNKFSVDAMVEKTLEIYERVLALKRA